jgi:hypothetical protein
VRDDYPAYYTGEKHTGEKHAGEKHGGDRDAEEPIKILGEAKPR